MPLTARDIMQPTVRTIGPDVPLVEADRELLAQRVTGFPVVERGQLVGMLSRSDIVRQLSVEQSLAEIISDYYHDGGSHDHAAESIEELAGRIGRRVEHLTVRDLMITRLITVGPDEPLVAIARTLVQHRIHRVPVTDGKELLGIVTSTDLVRLLAEGRLKEM